MKSFKQKKAISKMHFIEINIIRKKTWKMISELISKNRKSSLIIEIDLNGDLINDSS